VPGGRRTAAGEFSVRHPVPGHREWRSNRYAVCAKADGRRSINGVDLGVDAVEPPQEGYIWHKGKGGSVVAQKVSVTYACDYDQKEIPDGQHRLRRFSIDGRDYEIDLCLKHSERFDDAVGRYASHARKSSARVPKAKRRTAAHRKHSAEVRAWAMNNGLEVSERGRIPAEVVSKYESTHR
jgi:nucleoid-associated protein Lsr2